MLATRGKTFSANKNSNFSDSLYRDIFMYCYTFRVIDAFIMLAHETTTWPYAEIKDIKL